MPVDVKVNRMYRIDDEKKRVKAFADIEINGILLIKGLYVVNGKNGLFVSMPRERGKDNKFYETVRVLTPEVKEKITSCVLSSYTNQAAV